MIKIKKSEISFIIIVVAERYLFEKAFPPIHDEYDQHDNFLRECGFGAIFITSLILLAIGFPQLWEFLLED